MGKTVVRFCAIALTTLLIVVSLGGLYPQGLRAEGNTISIAVAASLSGDAATAVKKSSIASSYILMRPIETGGSMVVNLN
jgi:hypothetical protein